MRVMVCRKAVHKREREREDIQLMEEGTANVRCLRAPCLKVIETFAQPSNGQEGSSDVLNVYDIKSKLFG